MSWWWWLLVFCVGVVLASAPWWIDYAVQWWLGIKSPED